MFQKHQTLKLLIISAGIIMLSLIACSRQKARPAYVIDEQQMTEILLDMQLIEGVLNQRLTTSGNAFDFAQIYYDSLFVKYNINKAMLDSSLLYYGRRPEEFEKMLAKVMIAISKLEPAPAEEEPTDAPEN